MERYFALYPDDEAKAIRHYECNLMLAESLYVSLSVLEVTLRNALCRELETMTGREDWYAIFPSTPGLRSLNRYITEASQHITARHEQITPSKIVAELTLGFWVSLLNTEYERTLWHALRRAFPTCPGARGSAGMCRLRSTRSGGSATASFTTSPSAGICLEWRRFMLRCWR